jgi:hypothetical protein
VRPVVVLGDLMVDVVGDDDAGRGAVVAPARAALEALRRAHASAMTVSRAL